MAAYSQRISSGPFFYEFQQGFKTPIFHVLTTYIFKLNCAHNINIGECGGILFTIILSLDWLKALLDVGGATASHISVCIFTLVIIFYQTDKAY